jgi:transglutaminase-like putative cysteine protease
MPWLCFDTVHGEERRSLGPDTVLGRHPDCDVQILDRLASKHHCRVTLRDGRFVLADLGSLNGTWVNDAPVRGEVVLGDGDRVRIGATMARFFDAPPPEPSVVVRPPPRAVTPPPLEEPTALLARPLGDEAPHDNGLLVVSRSGDVRLRLWNVEVAQGGFVLRIPLGGDRPPSARLEHYVGKASGDEIVLEEGDHELDELAAKVTREAASLGELERVRYLNDLVFRALGGRLSADRLEACRATCAAHAGRPLPIGELLRIGAGVCRHRASLFLYLARHLGLHASLYRGAVPGGRHAWNEVRIGPKRVFADPSLGVVLEDALGAEQAYGYAASRFDLPPARELLRQSRVLVLGGPEGEAAQVELPHFRHELRKVPGDEEAVLLLYPERDLPDVRYLYVHLVVGLDAVAMFRLDPFVTARVFSIVGDEAHRLMDAVDDDALARLRTAFAALAGR